MARKPKSVDSPSGPQTALSSTQNTLSTALESAFLLLLGQTLFGSFALIFGLIELSDHSASKFIEIVAGTPESLLYCIFAFLLCSVLTVTIVIDWAATREAIYELKIYRNKHFTLDVCIIGIYFTLNNIVFFMSNLSTSSHRWAAQVSEMLQQPPTKFALFPGTVYILFSLYFFLCRKWNREYIASKNASLKWIYYDAALILGISLLLLMGVVSMLTANIIAVQYMFLLMWFSIVVYLDGIFIYINSRDG